MPDEIRTVARRLLSGLAIDCSVPDTAAAAPAGASAVVVPPTVTLAGTLVGGNTPVVALLGTSTGGNTSVVAPTGTSTVVFSPAGAS